MAAILYTILFLMGGLAIIRAQLPGKSPLVRAFLGLALGVLMEMELPMYLILRSRRITSLRLRCWRWSA